LGLGQYLIAAVQREQLEFDLELEPELEPELELGDPLRAARRTLQLMRVMA
jgi:hypothetical protein